jgi:hypothetical protein
MSTSEPDDGARPRSTAGRRRREPEVVREARALLARTNVEVLEAGRFRVRDGERLCTVSVCPAWSRAPECDCRGDDDRGGSGTSRGACRHVASVLLSRTDLSVHLLEVLL